MARAKTLGREDEIKIFYDYGLYLPTRTIVVESVQVDQEHGESGVDAHMWSRIEKGLGILENELPKNEGSNAITIVMNNPGGDLYHTLGIYDRIRSSPCPIVIEASGNVMSGGSIVFQAGDARRIHPNATMMIHYGLDSFSGTSKDLERFAAESRRVRSVMVDIYLERIRKRYPDFSREQMDELLEFDRWIPATEAVEFGLADEIIQHPRPIM